MDGELAAAAASSRGQALGTRHRNLRAYRNHGQRRRRVNLVSCSVLLVLLSIAALVAARSTSRLLELFISPQLPPKVHSSIATGRRDGLSSKQLELPKTQRQLFGNFGGDDRPQESSIGERLTKSWQWLIDKVKSIFRGGKAPRQEVETYHAVAEAEVLDPSSSLRGGSPTRLPSRSRGISPLSDLFGSSFSGMLGSLVPDVSSSIDSVKSAAASAVARSGLLGRNPRPGAVRSQSYSSVNINGQSTTKVSLQFEVAGDNGVGLVSCTASVSDGSVALQDVRLDGRPLDTRTVSVANDIIDV